MKIISIFKNIKNKPVDKDLTLSDKLYRELLNRAVGYSKRVKSSALMKTFEIKDNKTFRSYIQEIRQNEKYKKIVCSEAGKDGGYWVANNKQEVQDTLDHLYKRSMEMLKTYSIIKKKLKKSVYNN